MSRDDAMEAARRNIEKAKADAAESTDRFSRIRQGEIDAFRARVAAFIAQEQAAGYPHISTIDTSYWVEEQERVGIWRKETRGRKVEQSEPAWQINTMFDGPTSDGMDDTWSCLYLMLDGRFVMGGSRGNKTKVVEDLHFYFDKITRWFDYPSIIV